MTSYLFAAVLLAQFPQEHLMEASAKVAEILNSDDAPIQGVFHMQFLVALPEQKIRALAKDFRGKYGKVVNVLPVSTETPNGKFIFKFEKSVETDTTIAISPDSPHEVVGLLFGLPRPSLKSIDEVIDRLKALPGDVSFQISALEEEPRPLYRLNADKALAIGSTFKLYILASLLEQRVDWAETMTIEDDLKSLPAGVLQTWPHGSPVTLHTLACQMISISDNTATDHLLVRAGRKNVEGMLIQLKNQSPERSIPFLSTMEMFRIKANREMSQAYATANSEERTMLLEEINTENKKVDPTSIRPDPTYIDTIEWFASADDLCRVMHWFKQQNDPVVLGVMGINPGVTLPKEDFPYVGFKGGSEPGVLNFTWLLQLKGERWFAVSVSWNNTSEPVELEKLLPLAQSAMYLLASEQNEPPQEKKTKP